MAETAFKLRHSNIRTVQKAAGSGGWTAGDVVLLETGGAYGVVIGDIHGQSTIAQGDTAVVAVYAERIVLPTYATSEGVFAVGDRVFWDTADSSTSNTADTGTNDLIGICTKAAVQADEEVEIEFDGKLALAQS